MSSSIQASRYCRIRVGTIMFALLKDDINIENNLWRHEDYHIMVVHTVLYKQWTRNSLEMIKTMSWQKATLTNQPWDRRFVHRIDNDSIQSSVHLWPWMQTVCVVLQPFIMTFIFWFHLLSSSLRVCLPLLSPLVRLEIKL